MKRKNIIISISLLALIIISIASIIIYSKIVSSFAQYSQEDNYQEYYSHHITNPSSNISFYAVIEGEPITNYLYLDFSNNELKIGRIKGLVPINITNLILPDGTTNRVEQFKKKVSVGEKVEIDNEELIQLNMIANVFNVIQKQHRDCTEGIHVRDGISIWVAVNDLKRNKEFFYVNPCSKGECGVVNTIMDYFHSLSKNKKIKEKPFMTKSEDGAMLEI